MSTSMRSASLQKRFPTIYHDFFTNHDLVVSVPHTLRWWYGLARAASTVGIQQQLPTKMFGGVTIQESRSVRIASIVIYDAAQKSFVPHEITSIIKPQQIEKIEHMVEELFSTYGFMWGIEIDLLCEYKKGEGFGFMWTLFALLSTVIHVVSGQIKPDAILQQNFSTSSGCLQIQQLALYLDKYCLSWSGWASIAAAIASHALPIAQICQPTIPDHVPAPSDKQWSSSLRCFFWLHELYQTNITADELPIDFGVISFGLSQDCGAIKRAYQQSYRVLSSSYDRLMEIYEKRTNEHSSGPIVGSSGSHARDRYLYAHLLEQREQIMTSPGDDGAVDWFIQSIIDCWLYHLMIEKDAHQFFQLYAKFDELKNFPNEKFGLMPITTTKTWWAMLFVVRRGVSQSTMEQLLDRLRSIHPQAHFSYLSRRDWFCDNGIRIEQFLSQKINSAYITPGAVVFKWGDGRRYVWPHKEILQSEHSWIVLDQVYGKVYLEWEKTTYKQLRSQSWTTEIMSILLNSIWKYVPHSVFPPSSYSANKNEMIWKILSPLSSLVKEKFGVSLPIECNGGVYDFEVKLADNPNWLFNLISKVEGNKKDVKGRPM